MFENDLIFKVLVHWAGKYSIENKKKIWKIKMFHIFVFVKLFYENTKDILVYVLVQSVYSNGLIIIINRFKQ